MTATLPPLPPAGPPASRAYGLPTPPPAVLPAAAPPGRGLATAVSLASGVVALGFVAQAVSLLLVQDSLLEAVRAGDPDEAMRLTIVPGLAGLLTLVGWVAAFVLTGVWLLKLRRFSERVNPAFHHGRRRWWAFGGWVVPIVNLWFPLQYAGNVRDALRPNEHGGRLFGFWWASFLVAILAGNALTPSGEDVEDISRLGSGAAAQAGLVVVSLVLWLLVVRRLANAAREVPAEVVHRTAYTPDPEAYDPRATAPGQPIYGPAGAAGPTTWAPTPPGPPGHPGTPGTPPAGPPPGWGPGAG